MYNDLCSLPDGPPKKVVTRKKSGSKDRSQRRAVLSTAKIHLDKFYEVYADTNPDVAKRIIDAYYIMVDDEQYANALKTGTYKHVPYLLEYLPDPTSSLPYRQQRALEVAKLKADEAESPSQRRRIMYAYKKVAEHFPELLDSSYPHIREYL